MKDRYRFLDYLETLENCGKAYSEDYLFYLDTGVELSDFRKKGVWRCGFAKFKFPNLNEIIKSQKRRNSDEKLRIGNKNKKAF